MNETQIDRVYCREYIDCLNKYDAYKCTFRQLINKDSSNKTFGFSNDILAMTCIDTDAYETDQAGLNDMTMDCVCPIARFNDVKRTFSAKRLLLVELKLNCVNHNLNKNEYTGKISHTRQMLVTENLHGENIFIFTKDVKSKAVRQITSWKKGGNSAILKNTLVMSPDEFNNYIGFEGDFPYKYMTNADDITNSIRNNTDNVDQMVEELEYWKNKAENYECQQNKLESRHIFETLRKAVLESMDKIEEADKEYLKLYLYDI